MSHIYWDRALLDMRFAEAMRYVESLEAQRAALEATNAELVEALDKTTKLLSALTHLIECDIDEFAVDECVSCVYHNFDLIAKARSDATEEAR